jgi:NADH:ubiquinone oxidoreductase subunit 6 (subunit J)
MKKTVIVCGLIAGLVVSAVMAVSIIACYNDPEKMMGDGGMIMGYISMLIAFSLVFVGIKNYRDKQSNGVISFGKAFKIGFLISLIASTIYVLVWSIEYNFFVPDFMERYSAHMIRQAQTSSTPAEVEAKVAQMNQYSKMYKNPLFFVLLTYMEILPVGLIVSLISALILKRKNRKETIAVA